MEVKNNMEFLRQKWYYVGGGLFLALAAGLVLLWNDLSLLQRLLWLSFMALLAHQFEEYAWPGGFPPVFNLAFQPRQGGAPDRYPLNRKSALFVNVLFAYPFYILAIVFPGLIWLGLAQVAFGMAQLAVHGILINRKLHSIYNPGLFTVVFLHWPIGIYYIHYIIANGLAQWWTWPAALVLVAAAAFFGVNMPVTRWFVDKDSPYAFSETEMRRFHVQEKMERLSAGKR